MVLDVLLLVVGCIGLYYGGEFLIRGAVSIGERLDLSPAVIGLVLVSAGTSAPELAVSVGAAVQGLGDFSAGNVVGSNVVNIAVVLGLAAAITALPIERGLARRDLPLLAILSVICVWMLSDGHLGRLEATFLLAFTIANIAYALHYSRQQQKAAAQDVKEAGEDTLGAGKAVGLLAAGVVILVVSAEALIRSGTELAQAFGVAEAVIALTVTSIGTSIPEIAASLIAAARKQNDIAIGNVVGSNLFNIGLVLGVSGLITPIDSQGVGWLPLSVMLALTLFLWLMAATLGSISRLVGALLLITFVGYAVALVG